MEACLRISSLCHCFSIKWVIGLGDDDHHYYIVTITTLQLHMFVMFRWRFCMEFSWNSMAIGDFTPGLLLLLSNRKALVRTTAPEMWMLGHWERCFFFCIPWKKLTAGEPPQKWWVFFKRNLDVPGIFRCKTCWLLVVDCMDGVLKQMWFLFQGKFDSHFPRAYFFQMGWQKTTNQLRQQIEISGFWQQRWWTMSQAGRFSLFFFGRHSWSGWKQRRPL